MIVIKCDSVIRPLACLRCLLFNSLPLCSTSLLLDGEFVFHVTHPMRANLPGHAVLARAAKETGHAPFSLGIGGGTLHQMTPHLFVPPCHVPAYTSRQVAALFQFPSAVVHDRALFKAEIRLRISIGVCSQLCA